MSTDNDRPRGTVSERQARQLGWEKPAPPDPEATPLKSASARQAAQLGIGGDDDE